MAKAKTKAKAKTQRKKKNTRPRSPAELARDKRRVASMYLRGQTQMEIAAQVGRTQTVVSRTLKELQAAWIDSALVDFDQMRGEELAKIDNLEREYWEAWHRSVGEHRKTLQEKIKSDDGDKDKEQVRTEELVGDPKFLQGVLGCIDRRVKLLGLDEPQRFELGWKEQARKHGIEDPDAFEEDLVEAFIAPMVRASEA